MSKIPRTTRRGSTERVGAKAKSRFSFITNIISELRKVVWLSRRDALYLTFLVLVVSVSVGLILGALDFGFSRLVDGIFIGR